MISPASALESLKAYLTLHGLTILPVHLSGKVHNPENVDLAARLQRLCHQNPLLTLEDPLTRTKWRSNASGRLVTEGSGSSTDQVIDAILTSSCSWHDIMTIAAQELVHTGRRLHTIASFGLGDCVPLATFRDAGLDIVKIVGEELGDTPALAPLPAETANDTIRPPSVEPIAIVGMACRAPNANNTEELWDIISSGRSTMTEVPKTRIDIHGGFRASQDAKWIQGRDFYGNFIQDRCF